MTILAFWDRCWPSGAAFCAVVVASTWSTAAWWSQFTVECCAYSPACLSPCFEEVDFILAEPGLHRDTTQRTLLLDCHCRRRVKSLSENLMVLPP
jgi:hypothetical protein